MAVVIGGVAFTAWELALLGAAAVAALLASPPGQEAAQKAAREAADALDELTKPKPKPAPAKKPEPKPTPVPVPVDPTQPCPDCDKDCPPCVPPVGTIAYEVHRVNLNSKPHWPCPGDHVHFFLRQQIPWNCDCFWKRNALPVHCLNTDEPYIPRPGEVPL